MEYEKSVEPPTIKKLLGPEYEAGQEPGIIREYEGVIQRRAYDYLMIGFATDVDQVEDQREARFETYVDKIENDFADYRSEVEKWNKDLLDNTIPTRWQSDVDQYGNIIRDKYGQTLRRTDLPAVKVCEAARVIHPAISHVPSRDELEHVSQEGIEKFFDQALNDSYELLRQQQADIIGELPVAPHEMYDPGVRTYPQLVDEYARNVSRMSAIEAIYLERNPVDAADNLAYLQPELLGQTAPVTEKIYIVRGLGKATASLVRTA